MRKPVYRIMLDEEIVATFSRHEEAHNEFIRLSDKAANKLKRLRPSQRYELIKDVLMSYQEADGKIKIWNSPHKTEG